MLGKIFRQSGSFIVITILCMTGISAQPLHNDGNWNISAFYRSEWLTNGYIKVRELDIEGDKVQLQDVGMKNYPALQLQLERTFRNDGRLSLTYENYFIKGNAILDHNIEYNGTIINGSTGIDVAQTRFYRLGAHYHGNLYSEKEFRIQYIAGIVFDHTTFYLDGQVEPGSPRQEVYEKFGKQALPYPEAGISARYIYKKMNEFNLDVSGTYIPKFKNFYQEGGNMYLRYSTFLADLNYTHRFQSWEFTGGFQMRSTHLFGESIEDTNDLKMSIAAPYVGVGFNF